MTVLESLGCVRMLSKVPNNLGEILSAKKLFGDLHSYKMLPSFWNYKFLFVTCLVNQSYTGSMNLVKIEKY